jgi:hypothetical protein
MLYHGGVVEGQGDNNAGGAVERVTLTQAAALLGCHRNTVKNRIRAGMYRAEKVHTENGPTWMIERDSLTTNAPTSAPQQPTSGVSAAQQEAIQELARAIVRESGIGAETRSDFWLAQRDADVNRLTDATRDHWKVQYDLAKQTGTASGVLLLGLTALVGVFSPELCFPALAYAATALLVFAAVGSVVSMLRASDTIARIIDREMDTFLSSQNDPEEDHDPDEDTVRESRVLVAMKGHLRWRRLTIAALAAGAACLLGFAVVNLGFF